MDTPHSGTLADPRCALCTVPGPDGSPRHRCECPTCGRPRSSEGDCANCRLVALVRPLLTTDGAVRPELKPLLNWWENIDRPKSARNWLNRRPAARELLRALAEGTVPISHQGLDQVDDTNTARYLRRVLVACGVLPAHDEHLDRLQQWLHRALADIGDPHQRRIVSRYAHWHHLRRLRRRTGRDTPVTAGQAANVRSHVGAAAAVLAVLASRGRSLADLHQADVDQWLAEGQVARRAELGVFLHWARRERLTTVALPVEQWSRPRDPVDHDQRWRQARRLLHDETLRTEDRIAGLLVVLYAQPVTNIRTLRFDMIDATPTGTRITFGSTPIELPPTLVALIARSTADRAGTDRAHTPWIFPGRPWTQPISPETLRKRLATIGVPARAARTAALFQLAVELPAAVLARCLGIDISSAVAWQRAAAGDWHAYAARTANQE